MVFASPVSRQRSASRIACRMACELSGAGRMVAYDKYNKGELEDHIPTDEELQAGFDTIPHIPGLQ